MGAHSHLVSLNYSCHLSSFDNARTVLRLSRSEDVIRTAAACVSHDRRTLILHRGGLVHMIALCSTRADALENTGVGQPGCISMQPIPSRCKDDMTRYRLVACVSVLT